MAANTNTQRQPAWSGRNRSYLRFPRARTGFTVFVARAPDAVRSRTRSFNVIHYLSRYNRLFDLGV